MSRPLPYLLSLSALAGGSLFLAMSLPPPATSRDEARDKAIAFLREGAPLIIVYGTEIPEFSAGQRTAAEQVARWYRRALGRSPRLVSDRDLSPEDRREAALILLGRPEANAVVREMESRLPARFLPDGFAFGGREYRKPEHVLRLLLLSPWNRERPLLVVAGASHHSSLAARGFWLGRRDYSILEGRRPIRYGRLLFGQPDPASDIDLEAEEEAWAAGLRSFSSEHFELLYPAGTEAEAERESIALFLEERLSAARRQVGASPELCIRYQLYPSHEAKGKQVESVALSHIAPDSRVVHAIYDREAKGHRQAREIELLLDDAWGPPAATYLRRGLSLVLAGEAIEGKSALLFYQGFVPTREALLATDRGDSPGLPEPIYEAFAASWVSFLRQRLAPESFRTLYRGGGGINLERLEKDWRAHLERLARAGAAGFAAQSALSRAAHEKTPGFHKGFNYAYTNDRENGYPTSRSRLSLEALRKTGANAVALVPYGFSSPERLTEIRRAGSSIYGESDESVRVAAAQARSLGLRILLKPQIWVSYDIWPSGIDFQSEDEWAAWFRSYENWILPYALIAEELRVELFCVGTELTRASLKQPARFRDLISRIRRIYQGPLTYAANWHEEFERISFWDQLDFLGLDNYFPLAEGPEGGEAALRQGANQVAERLEKIARRYRKPVIFTEAGFPSLAGAGYPPEPEEEGRRLDLERQALLYRITFETYWPRPWFYGLYWWKWFSDPANAGPAGDRWTPRGKPAERVVAEWFGKPSPLRPAEP